MANPYPEGSAERIITMAERPTDREIADALCAADSILSLLRYRGLVDSEMNREDVNAASSKLEALRWWHEPMLRANPT